MPVQHLVDNTARLLALHFSGNVAHGPVEDAVDAIAAAASPEITYCSILIFHSSTDLARIGADELRTAKNVMTSADSESSEQRPSGAIVIDGALDARIIMPQWKAICDADADIDIHTRFFIEAAPALAWLDVLVTPALRSFLALPR